MQISDSALSMDEPSVENIDNISDKPNEGQSNITSNTSKTTLLLPVFIKGVHDYLGLINHIKQTLSRANRPQLTKSLN